MRGHYRHTKIIATVGPSTESPERLGQLITAGVEVLPLNMAHGTGERAAALIKRIREVSNKLGRHVADKVIDTLQLRQIPAGSS